jgi:hypothetical protein
LINAAIHLETEVPVIDFWSRAGMSRRKKVRM